MIPIVRSLKEAMTYFLSHSSGKCRCEDGERTEVVDSYPDAELFFEKQS